MGKLKSKKVIRENPSFDDIRDWYDENLHPDKLDIEDEEVYKHVYDEARFPAVFQFTSSGAQKLIQKFQPRSIKDIATATSIYRPGPLNAKVDKIYLENKKNVEKVKKSMHPLVWECLEETYGTIVFQEQVQLVAHRVGGFDLDETDKVRKALMKRSMKEKGKAAQAVIDLGVRFVEGAVKNGLSESEAKKLWEDLSFFSGYGFNACVTPETKVFVKRGNSYENCKVIDIKSGDEILSRDEKTKSVISVKVRKLHSNGKKKIVHVNLDTGAEVECTIDHKFRTTSGEMIPLWKIIAENLDIVVDDVLEDSRKLEKQQKDT